MSVYEDIRAERDRQNSLWGSRVDDANTISEWVFYIVGYLGKLYRSQLPFREVMVKVAALAVASIEAYDRRVEAGIVAR